MRVLSTHSGSDTGGFGWNHRKAFLQHGPVDIDWHSSVRHANYLNYPADIPWQYVRQYWRRADVVHLHNTLRTATIIRGAPKPIVLHHHGTRFRTDPETITESLKHLEGVAVTSTIDLLRYADNLTWCPQAHDLEMLARNRKQHKGPIRIAHAPTARAVKSTDAFLAACQKLKIEPVLIEGKSWRECLAIKGTCDILYDQVQLGYGNNAIESWAMGIPVIAGADRETIRDMRATFSGKLPFFKATEATIADAIRALMDNDTRAVYAAKGLAHAQRWHDGKESVTRLTAIYRDLAKR